MNTPACWFPLNCKRLRFGGQDFERQPLPANDFILSGDYYRFHRNLADYRVTLSGST